MKKFRSAICLTLVFSLIYSPIARAQEDQEARLDRAMAYLENLSFEQKIGALATTTGAASGIAGIYLALKANKFKPEIVNIIRTLKIRSAYWASYEPSAAKSLQYLFYNMHNPENTSTFFQDMITRNANLTREQNGIHELVKMFGSEGEQLDALQRQLNFARSTFQNLYNQKSDVFGNYSLNRFHELLEKAFQGVLSKSELDELAKLESRFDEVLGAISKRNATTSTVKFYFEIAQAYDQKFSKLSDVKLKGMMSKIKQFSQDNTHFTSNMFKEMEQNSSQFRSTKVVFLNPGEQELLAERSFKNGKFMEISSKAKGCYIIAGTMFLIAIVAFANHHIHVGKMLTETNYENMDPIQLRDTLDEDPEGLKALLKLADAYPL